MRALPAALALAAALAAGCRSQPGAPPPPAGAFAPSAMPSPSGGAQAPRAASRVPGEYLVTLAPGANPRVVEGAFAEAGVTSIRSVGIDLWLVTVRDDPGPERMAALRANDPRIRSVQPNFVYRSTR